MSAIKWLRQILAALVWLASAQAALAQNVLRIVVPFAPGGGGDLLARVLAPELAQALGMPVIVQNMPGANGAIAMQRVRQARSHEAVLVLASGHASAAAGDDMRQGFRMVGTVAQYPYALAVHGASAMASLGDLLRAAPDAGGVTGIAVPADGGLPYAIVRSLGRTGVAALVAVPYRGGSPAAAALAGGQVHAAAVGLSNLLALHREDRVRVLAVTGTQRAAALPGVPTFDELGVPGLRAMGSWSLLAARDTALPVAAINHALQRALADGPVQRHMLGWGMTPQPLPLQASRVEFDKARMLWQAASVAVDAMP